MKRKIELSAVVPESMLGCRLDQALSQLFTDFSRTRLKGWLDTGCVSLNGQVETKARTRIYGNEVLIVNAELEVQTQNEAQHMELDVIYEDDDIAIINKPANLVVHPGAGQKDQTLMNALLYQFPEISHVPRAGIVHRLDKDTTGLMVIAKNVEAQTKLVKDLAVHAVVREYEAIVLGILLAGGKIDQPIGRHPQKRTLMAVKPQAKPAVTHYRVAERFREHTRVRVRLETGRTHQIRVHMAWLSHPLLGDTAYGGRVKLPKGASATCVELIRGFKRQALHAVKLELSHPISGEFMRFEAPIPSDMQQLTESLREDMLEHGSFE